MFSIADMAVAGAVALLLFGPDQLPKVARRAGQLVRDVQNTSQSFIREMERAADHQPASVDAAASYAEPDYPAAPEAPAVAGYHEAPEPAPHDLVVKEAALGPHPGDTVPPADRASNGGVGPPIRDAFHDSASTGVRDAVPVVGDVAPVVHDAVPVARDAVPVVHDGVPVARDAVPVSHAGAPVVAEVASVVPDLTPVARDVGPAAEDAGPTVHGTPSQTSKPAP